jgi:FMN phosphatase YigB (HAD superfamily)
MTDLPLVVLFDVDNTLIDNDALKETVGLRVRAAVGKEGETEFWRIYEQMRANSDVVDYEDTIAEFERIRPDVNARELVYGVDWKSFVLRGAVEAIRYAATFATTAILSDGDGVYQPFKVRATGLEALVDGRVMIVVHKERETAELMRRFPARHYVAVDDKPRILPAMRAAMGDKVTTVFVRQGRYANAADAASYAPADFVIDRIGQFVDIPESKLAPQGKPAAP